jgi:hypothetical protein
LREKSRRDEFTVTGGQARVVGSSKLRNRR